MVNDFPWIKNPTHHIVPYCDRIKGEWRRMSHCWGEDEPASHGYPSVRVFENPGMINLGLVWLSVAATKFFENDIMARNQSRRRFDPSLPRKKPQTHPTAITELNHLTVPLTLFGFFPTVNRLATLPRVSSLDSDTPSLDWEFTISEEICVSAGTTYCFAAVATLTIREP